MPITARKTTRGIILAVATLALGVFSPAADAQSEAPIEEARGAFRRLISVTERINFNFLDLPFADKIAAKIPRSEEEAVELAKKIGEAGKSAGKPLDLLVKTYTYPVLNLLVKAVVFIFDRLGDLFRYVFRV